LLRCEKFNSWEGFVPKSVVTLQKILTSHRFSFIVRQLMSEQHLNLKQGEYKPVHPELLGWQDSFFDESFLNKVQNNESLQKAWKSEANGR
jgi:hypothetical protein